MDNIEQNENIETTENQNVEKEVDTQQSAGVDNSQAKKIREATKQKVAQKYEKEIEDYKSVLDSYKETMESQANALEQLQNQVNGMNGRQAEIEKQRAFNNLANIGVGEDALEDAYAFAEYADKVGMAEDDAFSKIEKYFASTNINNTTSPELDVSANLPKSDGWWDDELK